MLLLLRPLLLVLLHPLLPLLPLLQVLQALLFVLFPQQTTYVMATPSDWLCRLDYTCFWLVAVTWSGRCCSPVVAARAHARRPGRPTRPMASTCFQPATA